MGKCFRRIDTVHTDDSDTHSVCVGHSRSAAGTNIDPAPPHSASPSDRNVEPVSRDAVAHVGSNCLGTGDGSHHGSAANTVRYHDLSHPARASNTHSYYDFIPIANPIGRRGDGVTCSGSVTHTESTSQESDAEGGQRIGGANRGPGHSCRRG